MQVTHLVSLRDIDHLESLSRVRRQGILRQPRHARPQVQQRTASAQPASNPVTTAADAAAPVLLLLLLLRAGLQASAAEVLEC
jgi:hypothetical protein